MAKSLQTPAPSQARTRAPTTIRTVRRGEAVFSKNGSPLEQGEEGTIVATVAKKRRGENSTVFDINVGDGRIINLADMQDLDKKTKETAVTQLKLLQDQMASLMAQLEAS